MSGLDTKHLWPRCGAVGRRLRFIVIIRNYHAGSFSFYLFIESVQQRKLALPCKHGVYIGMCLNDNVFQKAKTTYHMLHKLKIPVGIDHH